ncbi:hypothetical protein [Mesorhizobium captivum]|uniref:hypothetical protein n=1 Tax=Mesorhizobium captivum TaxID=3072319 RepID=UPI002A24B3EA|nr:hypothetical protein [Mesorhizobium sp. VK3C]MDX8450698.1 hypothetical protein [Mesorhizobium sp. VK3C]
MSIKTELFKVRTVIPEFEGCKDVAMRWFVCERERPPAPYAEVIADYQPGDPYAEGSIDELFIADEARALVGYLEAHYPDCSHSIEEVDLPITDPPYPIGALSVGGPEDYYMLCEEEGYTLPFPVFGYFDLRNHEPLPDRESDLKRRKAFARGTLIVTCDGKIIRAADLEKIEPLQ